MHEAFHEERYRSKYEEYSSIERCHQECYTIRYGNTDDFWSDLSEKQYSKTRENLYDDNDSLMRIERGLSEMDSKECRNGRGSHCCKSSSDEIRDEECLSLLSKMSKRLRSEFFLFEKSLNLVFTDREKWEFCSCKKRKEHEQETEDQHKRNSIQWK